MSGVSVDLSTGPGGLAALQDEWDAVVSGIDNVDFTHLYAWQAAYLEHLEAHPERVIFVALRREGKLRGVLVLRPETHRKHKLKVSTLATPVELALDLTDFVVAPGESLADWWRPLCKALRQGHIRWSAIRVGRTRENGLAMAACAGLGPRTIYRVQGRSSYVDCTRDYASVRAGYSSRLAKNVTKGWKKLSSLGEVRLETAVEPEARAAAFSQFLQLEASGWKGEDGTRTALAFDPKSRRFLSALFGVEGPGEARVKLLRAGDTFVAAQLCMLVDGVRYVLKIGHDQELQKMSPGSVLFDAVLQRTCEDPNVRAVSFVTGYPWVEEWGANAIPTGDLWLFRHRRVAELASIMLRSRAS
jgi:CelD/BcsL family acetyltransferase involved in cellulose biosynthesis